MRNRIKTVGGIAIAAFLAFFAYYHYRVELMPEVHKPYKPVLNEYSEVNLRLIDNSLCDSTAYSHINKEISRFVKNWDLTGACVAIAFEGKLVYTRGFGWANKEDTVRMQPYNVLRVASVSKLITAVAVMRLVEAGRLNLDDLVFGENGLLNDSIFSDIKDERVRTITVHNLLNHSAGWNVRYGDHMFMKQIIAQEMGVKLPISLHQIVQFAVTRRKLHYMPGTSSQYCNLSYAILQLVIEKVSGVPYEKFVQLNVFDPLRIHDAHIAQNWDSQKLPDEVRYYEVPEADTIVAYDGSCNALKSRGGNDITTLGAAGGWAISPISLLRFMLAVDGNTSFPDIISQSSYQTMVNADEGFSPYGWIMKDKNGDLWRSGSLPGTTVLAKSCSNGFSFVFVANKSPWKGSRFPYLINGLMNKVLVQFDSTMCTRNLFYAQPPELQEPILGAHNRSLSSYSHNASW